MSLLCWKEEYCVNIQALDRQHKKLVGMINRLHDAMLEKKGKELISITLEDLLAYSKTHFAKEEVILTQAGYPGALYHKTLHDELTIRLQEIVEKHQSGVAMISLSILRFLEDWFHNHLVGEDQKFAAFLKNKRFEIGLARL